MIIIRFTSSIILKKIKNILWNTIWIECWSVYGRNFAQPPHRLLQTMDLDVVYFFIHPHTLEICDKLDIYYNSLAIILLLLKWFLSHKKYMNILMQKVMCYGQTLRQDLMQFYKLKHSNSVLSCWYVLLVL